MDGTAAITTRFPDRVTVALEQTTLGEAIHVIGLKSGGRFVVMNGLESVPLSALRFKNAKFSDVAEKLSKQAGCALQSTPYYYFFYPAGYEKLTELSLVDVTSLPLQQNVELVQFGYGIPLYAVFSWIGQSLGTTIVADNAIAEARCGEVSLRDIRLIDAVEAILKSARVAEFRSETTQDYLFLFAPGNPNPSNCLLNEDSLDLRQKEYLDKRVTVVLPAPPKSPGTIRIDSQALPLQTVLPEFSRQLGVKVVAEESIRAFPVNPVTFYDVSVRVAMDLLIRQWLGGNCGYQFLSDRIVIRHREITK